MKRTKLEAKSVDGVIIGWVGQGSHAPNIARIAALKGRLAETVPAYTIQANCVSGMESISSAARHIILGEGDLYIAGGTESMSTFPYAIRGPRSAKALRSTETLKAEWAHLWENPEVLITDTMEEGLVDPVKKLNMAATAEVLAQMFGITREQQDKYAHESFKRCSEGEKNGFYKTHMIPVMKDGQVVLDSDEYVGLRESLVQKPEMFKKAPVLFDSSGMSIKDFYEKFGEHIEGKKYDPSAQATITLFNACARSDGAAGIIVTSEEKAKELGLEIFAELKSWAFYGVNPAHMGVGPAYASNEAIHKAGLKFEQLDQIEVHEAFAATVLSVFHVGKTKFNQDWMSRFQEKRINPNGGSIPLGHPLAATGTRIILNLIHALKARKGSKYGLATACASGGLGGAMVIENVA
jgi:acetyl-CoA C-acetyltransferase